jgi:hypothetical protein
LRCWKAAFEQKKRDKYIEDRRKADLRALFDRNLFSRQRLGEADMIGWMEATVQSVQDGQAVDRFQQGSEKVSVFLPEMGIIDVASAWPKLYSENGLHE